MPYVCSVLNRIFLPAVDKIPRQEEILKKEFVLLITHYYGSQVKVG